MYPALEHASDTVHHLYVSLYAFPPIRTDSAFIRQSCIALKSFCAVIDLSSKIAQRGLVSCLSGWNMSLVKMGRLLMGPGSF